MTEFEEHTHVFIVRLWREPREIEGASPEWRGVVEHVSSGQRRFLRKFADLKDFISGYQPEIGA